jgi:hypothetical protein
LVLIQTASAAQVVPGANPSSSKRDQAPKTPAVFGNRHKLARTK